VNVGQVHGLGFKVWVRDMVTASIRLKVQVKDRVKFRVRVRLRVYG